MSYDQVKNSAAIHLNIFTMQAPKRLMRTNRQPRTKFNKTARTDTACNRRPSRKALGSQWRAALLG
jgi:hypothetical protein